MPALTLPCPARWAQPDRTTAEPAADVPPRQLTLHLHLTLQLSVQITAATPPAAAPASAPAGSWPALGALPAPALPRRAPVRLSCQA